MNPAKNASRPPDEKEPFEDAGKDAVVSLSHDIGLWVSLLALALFMGVLFVDQCTRLREMPESSGSP